MPKPETSGQPKETLGKLFPDGSAIERLSDQRLLLRRNGEELIGPTVSHNGQVYAAALLDPKLEALIALPAETSDFGTIESLATELSMAISSYLALDEETALLVAAFVLSTWVIECLPSTVCLNPWGPAGTETNLIEILSSLCRHPLRLVEPSLRELASLPEGLCPTLILKQPSARVLGRLLAAAGEPDVQLLQGGRLVNLRCATVVCSQYPIVVRALPIPLISSESRYRRLSKADLQNLAEEFHPRLLRYRLTQHLPVAASPFDEPNFAPEARVLARLLGAAVEGASAVQGRIVAALEPLDEQHKSEQAQSLSAIVLEALLALCHEDNKSVYVFELTEVANTILFGRQDHRELSPKAVGAILRNELGLAAKRSGPGYELPLTNDLRARVHRLAASHDMLTMLQPKPDCPWCDGILGTTTTEIAVPSTSSTQSAQVHGS